MRGEHKVKGNLTPFELGPSPRARGALLPRAHGAVDRGTIPACAGSTSPATASRRGSRDHPRVRGEHPPLVIMVESLLGPSPRARGARVDREDQFVRLGTIPACAGSTQVRCEVGPETGDHPRVRGEHPAPSGKEVKRVGPSPRARGAHDVSDQDHDPVGTIPACAGSTSSPSGRSGRSGDHPRVRGEHRVNRSLTMVSGGPSPRARGAHRAGHRRVPGAGTIPACAGSTCATRGPLARRRDHPRVRGEHNSRTCQWGCHPGPSPRARGAQSTTCELTSGKQPFFQLLQKQTKAPQTPTSSNNPPSTETMPLQKVPNYGPLSPFAARSANPVESPWHTPNSPRTSQDRWGHALPGSPAVTVGNVGYLCRHCQFHGDRRRPCRGAGLTGAPRTPVHEGIGTSGLDREGERCGTGVCGRSWRTDRSSPV